MSSSVLFACGGGGRGGPVLTSGTPPAGPVSSELVFEDVANSVGLSYFSQTGPAFASTPADLALTQQNLGSGAAVGDYDNDGDLDVYAVSHAGFKNTLFRNNLEQGTATFSEVNAPILEDINGMARLAHFVDLDNDGHLDLLLINDDDGGALTFPSRIFRNNGDGTFADVSAMSGFRPVGCFQGGTAIADYDLDGLLDIYVTRWCAETATGSAQLSGANQLFRNLGGFQFADVSDQVNLGGLDRDSFTAIFTDFYDNDYPDLYVAVDHTSDAFFYNDLGAFIDQTSIAAVSHTGNDMGVAAADFDDDGDLDMYVTNITDPGGIFGTTEGNVLYVNQLAESGDLAFSDKAIEFGVDDTYWGWGTEFVDVENDGDLDIMTVTGFDEIVRQRYESANRESSILETPPVLFVNNNGSFERTGSGALRQPDDSRALIAFDYDRDGDQDFLITSIDTPVRLLKNDSENQGNWLDLRLMPDNKAIGATVFADIAGVTKRRDIIAGRSFYAGTPSEVHFGLGAATQIDLLRIRWSDGSEETHRNVTANQLIEFRASAAP